MSELTAQFAVEAGDNATARKRKSDEVEILQQRDRKCKMLLVEAMHDSQLELVQGNKSATEM